MSSLRASWMRFCNLFRRRQLDRNIDDELATHLDLHIADNLHAGMSPGEARREIGVRTALGASASQIMNLILRQGIATAMIGIAVGALLSLALTRWIQSLLFEVSPVDPVTYCGVALLLVLAVLAACWIPARRATRVHPTTALRYE